MNNQKNGAVPQPQQSLQEISLTIFLAHDKI